MKDVKWAQSVASWAADQKPDGLCSWNEDLQHHIPPKSCEIEQANFIMNEQQSDPADLQVGSTDYRIFAITPSEYNRQNQLSWDEGNVIKYTSRHNRGGKGAEDIRKAIHYLQFILWEEYDETL